MIGWNDIPERRTFDLIECKAFEFIVFTAIFQNDIYQFFTLIEASLYLVTCFELSTNNYDVSKMGSQPLVTVVTPVYNCEKFIDECIQSVIAQTYTNFEYFIIDNKSKDNTFFLAKEHERRDGRIHVIHNETFLPVMENFNKAAKQISGKSKYCKFVCADDWLFPDCIAKMVELAESNSHVGIVGSYRLVEDEVVPKGIPYAKTIFAGKEMARMNLMDGPYTFGSPSAILYRSEIIREKEHFFKENTTAGDTEACYEILKQWDFGFVHQLLTFNRIHDNSVTSSGVFLNTELVNHFLILQKYGPLFLTKDELDLRIKKVLRSYYRFLGGHPLRLFKKNFLEFHLASMEKLDLPFSWPKVVGGALFVATKRVLDTKQNLKKLVSLVSRN